MFERETKIEATKIEKQVHGALLQYFFCKAIGNSAVFVEAARNEAKQKSLGWLGEIARKLS